VDFDYTEIFTRNKICPARTIVNIGGARSSKSYSILQLFIYKMLTERNKTFGILRKTFPALRITAYKTFIEFASQYKLLPYSEHNKSEHLLKYLPNNNSVYFFSLDDPEKIKSSEFNYLFLEEANEFTNADYLTLLTRLSAKNELRNQIFLALNPSDFHGWIPQNLVKDRNVEVIKSTYKDNPFLPKEYIELLEGLREQNLNAYKIFTLGEWGQLEHLIFQNVDFITSLTNYDFEAVFYGLDFGFNNPTTLVKIGLKEKAVYIDEVLYEPKLTNADLIERMKEAGIPADAEIYADAAEPNRIEEISRAGFNIFPADKDVGKGIDCLKSLRIYATKNSANMIKELQRYSWQVDNAGIVLDKPVKVDDHAIDAMRYGVFSFFKKYKMQDNFKITWA